MCLLALAWSEIAAASELCVNPDVQSSRAALLCRGTISFGEGVKILPQQVEVEQRGRGWVFLHLGGPCGRSGRAGSSKSAVPAGVGRLCPPRPGAPRRGPHACRSRGQRRDEGQAPVLRRGSSAGRKQLRQRRTKGSGRRVLAAAFSDR